MTNNRFAWYKLKWYSKYFISQNLLQVAWGNLLLLTEGGGSHYFEKQRSLLSE